MKFATALVVSMVLTLIPLTSKAELASFPGILADVYSGGKFAKDNSEYIHVTINEDKTATFQFCRLPGVKDCDRLGNKDRYSMRELQKKYKKLRKDARHMMLSDATFVALSAIAGTIAAATLATPAGPEVIAIYAGSGAAGASIFIIKSYMTPGAANAYQKYREARTINDDILSGKPVYVNEPMTDFAERLDTVLKTVI